MPASRVKNLVLPPFNGCAKAADISDIRAFNVRPTTVPSYEVVCL